MANTQQISDLRRLVSEPADEGPYTNAELSRRIDADGGDLRASARAIWTEKAASYAELTDVQEGSSRRSLGDLHEQALLMAKNFGAGEEESAAQRRVRPGTRAIVRP